MTFAWLCLDTRSSHEGSGEQLFDEKGIAFRQWVEDVQQIGRQCRLCGRDLMQHIIHLISREGGQRELLGESFTMHLDQERSQRERKLITAVGAQEEQRQL